MGSPPEVFTGRFSGEVLTVAHGGPGMHARLTYDLSEPGVLRSKMEMSQDGTVWNTLFDGRYTRARARPAVFAISAARSTSSDVTSFSPLSLQSAHS